MHAYTLGLNTRRLGPCPRVASPLLLSQDVVTTARLDFSRATEGLQRLEQNGEVTRIYQ